MLKADLSDGFYRIGLNPEDAPKLGLVFPEIHGGEQLVAIPLTLPMGWKKIRLSSTSQRKPFLT